MKKFFLMLLLGSVVLTHSSLGFAENYADLAKSPVNIEVNGEEISSYDSEQKINLPAVIVNNRTMMPLKRTFDIFGVDTVWNADERSVSAMTPEGGSIWLQIGSNKAKVNGEEIHIEAAPMIFLNRTFVPLGFVSEAMGVKPQWNGESRLVSLEVHGKNYLSIPAFLKNDYSKVYEKDTKTTFYYHFMKAEKSVALKKEDTDKSGVLGRLTKELNISSEDFKQISEKDSWTFSYENLNGVSKQWFIFEKENQVYSVMFSDFSTNEALVVVKGL